MIQGHLPQGKKALQENTTTRKYGVKNIVFSFGYPFCFVVRFFVNMWGFERKYIELLYLNWAPKPLSNTDIEQTVLIL